MINMYIKSILSLLVLVVITAQGKSAPSEKPIQLSGIYPHLAMFNNENECGTGAVVPWADRLWVITYAPHAPKGSSDKLYEITPNLQQIIRPESTGGTPANRMIHQETKQLFIGPYAIDTARNVRTIPYSSMFGRLTGTTRSLDNPSEKILYATMEEGIYEVDVKSLAVKELWGDEQKKDSPRKSNLPGYHGKGFYSGQGVYVYSNNGEHGRAAMTRPDVPSGVLAEWDGKADDWKTIRRNQFTEITGPQGISGNKSPQSSTDPIWALGWDDKSLLLGVRMPEMGWTFYRLPKGSHSYDGAHGWNTEWPRIREIGEKDFLMTMHGTFWKFPASFTPSNSAGISPRSNYLKVIGDFCRWNDHLVLGCDDTAKAEFLNKRKAKGDIAAPQSQSNLWFVAPDQIDNLGPVIGRGAVWLDEKVTANPPSDPYLFDGYDIRGLHLQHSENKTITYQLEVDRKGNGQWSTFKQIEVPASGYEFVSFNKDDQATWIRLRCPQPLNKVSAIFTYRNLDPRSNESATLFNGLAQPKELITGGIVRARGDNKRTLSFAAVIAVTHDDKGAKKAMDIGYYELDAQLNLQKVTNPTTLAFTKSHAAIATGALKIDAASVIYIDEEKKQWRLPKSDSSMDSHPLGAHRIAREVATERDLLNAHGTFYELPARNAGGIAKLRAITTHNRLVHDFCSYRGLLIISGNSTNAPANNPHIIRSNDGKTSLWAGAIDDVWKLGKPRGHGGPWKNSTVRANIPSDPYLMSGYDQKHLSLKASSSCKITAQIDIHGNGHWVDYKTFTITPDSPSQYRFPEAFQAYWIRFVSDTPTTASAQLKYR